MLVAESSEGQSYNHMQAWDILYQTVSLLKEAGNEALKSSQPSLAAQRYDKAINYCSIAYLHFPVGNSLFLAEHQYVISKSNGFECRWNPLLKQLIMIRLNLSMCFLKEELKDTKEALSQANLALRALRPFTEKGVVLTGKKLSKKRKDEPQETFKEAKSLQAKAYFRLGSAQLAAADFEEAVTSFDKSAKCSKEADLQVEDAVVRKLNEAKRQRKQKKEKERKKFKLMFTSQDEDK
jgi:tetratricopeptide (TPR) repeat protein